MDARNQNHNKGKSNKGNTFTCTYCGEDVHSKAKCCELIGYPEWWDFTKKPRKKIGQAAVVKSPQTEETTTPMAAHTSANTSMSYTTKND